MDFFERAFHVAPDGGNGCFEFMLFLDLIILCVLAVWRKSSQRS